MRRKPLPGIEQIGPKGVAWAADHPYATHQDLPLEIAEEWLAVLKKYGYLEAAITGLHARVGAIEAQAVCDDDQRCQAYLEVFRQKLETRLHEGRQGIQSEDRTPLFSEPFLVLFDPVTGHIVNPGEPPTEEEIAAQRPPQPPKQRAMVFRKPDLEEEESAALTAA